MAASANGPLLFSLCGVIFQKSEWSRTAGWPAGWQKNGYLHCYAALLLLHKNGHHTHTRTHRGTPSGAHTRATVATVVQLSDAINVAQCLTCYVSWPFAWGDWDGELAGIF